MMAGNGLEGKLQHHFLENLLSLVAEAPYVSSEGIPQIAAYFGVNENRVARALSLLVSRRLLTETKTSDGTLYSIPCRTIVYMGMG